MRARSKGLKAPEVFLTISSGVLGHLQRCAGLQKAAPPDLCSPCKASGIPGCHLSIGSVPATDPSAYAAVEVFVFISWKAAPVSGPALKSLKAFSISDLLKWF